MRFAGRVALLGWAVSLASCESERAATTTPAPPPMTLDVTALTPIDAVVQVGLDAQRMPGCVVMIGRHDGVVLAKAYGERALRPAREAMTLDTVFDLASLTKPLATATSVMLLVERGQVSLDDPVALYVPEFGANGKDAVTVRQLLTHVGGLIPDNALEDYEHGSEEAWRRIFALDLRHAPGEVFSYTDVGFLVLGALVERVSGRDLASFAREEIYEPLGMRETGFLPAAALRERAAVTELRDGRWMRGEVHDPRAHLLGGVAGHAGLFSTATDLSRFARMMLQGGVLDGARVLSPRSVQEMTRAHAVPGGRRGLGWDVRSVYSKNRGDLFRDAAFGHGGFTGTVLWIDPGLDLFVVFLSNRVHPDGKGSVNRLAGRIGSIAAAALRPLDDGRGMGEVLADGSALRVAEPVPVGAPVSCGIDVLEARGFDVLRGRRVGLITNHTGRTRDGRTTARVLHEAPDVHLVALFSPEHGLAGRADARVGDAVDPDTGLPVFSLYGESRRPDPTELASLDVMVFDIQDVGTRFYTYISTLGLAMEACAEVGVAFVVLDRPNPVNGVDVGGPLRDPGTGTFVAFHEIPVRHGMTSGELARMFRVERGLDLDLTVVPVQGWRRQDFFDRTGLTWVNPSPNMRSVQQALLYPGVGLLEFTELSVGRGTDTPFELLGAPWLDGAAAAWALNHEGLPGLAFVPVEFTPTASKFAGEPCRGLQLLITDRARVDPIWTGLAIACHLRDVHGDVWDPAPMQKLLVNAAVYDAFVGGATALELMQRIDEDVQQFRLRRRPFLLY